MNEAEIQPNIIVITPPSLLCVSKEQSVLVLCGTHNKSKIVNLFVERWPNMELFLYLVENIDEETLHWLHLYQQYCHNTIIIVDENDPMLTNLAMLYCKDRRAWVYDSGNMMLNSLLLKQNSVNYFTNMVEMLEQLIKTP